MIYGFGVDVHPDRQRFILLIRLVQVLKLYCMLVPFQPATSQGTGENEQNSNMSSSELPVFIKLFIVMVWIKQLVSIFIHHHYTFSYCRIL
ncbi:hypothetical protein [Paenibacillus sp. 4624]|uniref:hypothetical protein n=1 Tax=Paenibacillus sp. 4624 TaxID=3156453 RepID=UPI003D194583